jgi:hypothetical protein
MSQIILPGGMPAFADLTEFEKDVLSQAKANKIALGVEDSFEKRETQMAFVQAVSNYNLQLLDVTVIQPGPNQPPRLMRIFGITPKGEARLREIMEKKKIDKSMLAG